MYTNTLLIDVTRLMQRYAKERLPTGIDRVGLAYVQHFFDRARAIIRLPGRVLWLSPTASHALFTHLLNPGPDFKRRVLGILIRAYFSRPYTAGIKDAFLLNTGHSGLEKASYPKSLRRFGVQPVFFVHDLIPITHPEYCRIGEFSKHHTRINHVLQLARGVITNSQATLDELNVYAHRTGQQMPIAISAPLASALLPSQHNSTRPITASYFVMLSTIEPRKNHSLILQLWRKLSEQMGSATPKLVIIGQRGWDCDHVVNLLTRCTALREHVLELPSCTDTQLALYLQHARALLFPSFIEGYGMPLIEALTLGLPVIASDLPVFREIAGDIPDYLDALDGLGWMAAIKDYNNTNSAARAAQCQRMTHFVSPTWSTHFRLVESLLTTLKAHA
ncbi:MAG: glycosyltransferase family 4 protein [Ottowia sp.]|nr:glycosyltransferase family 4 protein [Ottowia sp.]